MAADHTSNGVNTREHGVKRFQLGRSLGSGAFGTVRLAAEVSSGKQVAIKSVQLSHSQNISGIERAWREVFILTSLDHEHVIRLHDVIKSEKELLFVMEWADAGSLKELLDAFPDRPMKEAYARAIFREIAAGVRYCHRQNVVHRDLKPDNILFVSKEGCMPGVAKIADFGLSSTVTSLGRARSPVGTPLFSAPEIVSPQTRGSTSKAYNASRADCWSLGVILYRMIFGQLPFNSRTLSELQIAQRSGCPTITAKEGTSHHCISLIVSLLTFSPNERLTAEEILHHSWFSQPVPPNARFKAFSKMFQDVETADPVDSAPQAAFCCKEELVLSHERSGHHARASEDLATPNFPVLRGHAQEPQLLSASRNKVLQSLGTKKEALQAASHVQPTAVLCSVLDIPSVPAQSLHPSVATPPPALNLTTLPHITEGVTSPRCQTKQEPLNDVDMWTGLSGLPSAASQTFVHDPSEHKAHCKQQVRHRSNSCMSVATGSTHDKDSLFPKSPVGCHSVTKALSTGKRVVRRRRSHARSATSSPNVVGSAFFADL